MSAAPAESVITQRERGERIDVTGGFSSARMAAHAPVVDRQSNNTTLGRLPSDIEFEVRRGASSLPFNVSCIDTQLHDLKAMKFQESAESFKNLNL